MGSVWLFPCVWKVAVCEMCALPTSLQQLHDAVFETVTHLNLPSYRVFAPWPR